MAFLAAEQLTENSATRGGRFHVMLNHGEWKITYGGRDIGPFASREHAIAAAIEAANESACLTHRPQVLVHDDDGRIRTIWTYCEDPYPLTG
jgi:hypothetical protein